MLLVSVSLSLDHRNTTVEPGCGLLRAGGGTGFTGLGGSAFAAEFDVDGAAVGAGAAVGRGGP